MIENSVDERDERDERRLRGRAQYPVLRPPVFPRQYGRREWVARDPVRYGAVQYAGGDRIRVSVA